MRLALLRWPLTVRVARQADLMDRKLQVLRVDAAAAARRDGGKAFAKARALCLCCRNCRACRDWLEAAESLPLPADFCPNADFFRDLMAAPAAAPAFDEAQCHRP